MAQTKGRDRISPLERREARDKPYDQRRKSLSPIRNK